MSARRSPAGAIACGLAAGAIGTAIFTVYQTRIRGAGSADPPPPREWSDAPDPARVGERVASGVFGKDVPIERAPLLTNIVHWAYGSGWGAVYGVIRESAGHPALSGVGLTCAVMATDYTLLPAMGIYEPPWRYRAATIARDFADHLVHGLAVAAAYGAIDRVSGT
jgi:hypothetical protein